MDADSVAQQECAQTVESSALSARQFYRHDPLLILLKEKLHLSALLLLPLITSLITLALHALGIEL